MNIVVAVRCYNEEKNIERFLRCYDFADHIVISDGGSDDRSVEIAESNPKVTLCHFDQYEERDGMKWNPDAPHMNFVLDKAKELNPDWLIFDDMDDVPTRKLQQNARSIFEGLEPQEHQVNAFRLYLWGYDKYFPWMNRNFDIDYTSLWAWRPDKLNIHADVSFHHGTLTGLAPHTDNIRRMLPPYSLLHYSWNPETIDYKRHKYATFGIDMGHPLEKSGELKTLPNWAVI